MRETQSMRNQTQLCAILNVTPDSFSDGGKYFRIEQAVKQAKKLIASGADMLDIGGESTRPGSTIISIEEEIKRVVPVVLEIRKFSSIPISVDTWKSEVADAALEAGANIINDITGLFGDSNMAYVIAKHQAKVIMMFNAVLARPTHEASLIFPKFYKEAPFSKEELDSFSAVNALDLMSTYLNQSIQMGIKAGLEKDQMILDPGIGFGLTNEENLSILSQIDRLKALGCPIFLGVSRKRFLTNALDKEQIKTDGEEGLHHKDVATSMISLYAMLHEIDILRVHDLTWNKLASQLASQLLLDE